MKKGGRSHARHDNRDGAAAAESSGRLNRRELIGRSLGDGGQHQVEVCRSALRASRAGHLLGHVLGLGERLPHALPAVKADAILGQVGPSDLLARPVARARELSLTPATPRALSGPRTVSSEGPTTSCSGASTMTVGGPARGERAKTGPPGVWGSPPSQPVCGPTADIESLGLYAKAPDGGHHRGSF